MRKIAIITFLFLALNLSAQNEYEFRKNINKDSLFNASVKKVPEFKREEFIKIYKEGNNAEKDFLLFMIAMPTNSKNELIKNYENKKTEILNLKQEYQKLVPKNYVVDIEFEPESKILTVSEQITIKIFKSEDKSDKLEVISQNWNLKPNSIELEKILKSINWTNQTLIEIRKLLENSNCISIENGKITTIGYARSGMGKYSYVIFENPLTSKQKDEYNNGCEYIYYKDNVVLEYGGGAVGQQCFEKE